VLLFYFLGLRRSEVIGLRGKDLEFKEGAPVIKHRRKGGKFTAREAADPTAYEAPKDYLEAAGGMSVVESGRPPWTRHDRAGRPGASLTIRASVENLKAYAQGAGLAHIHLHQTRHTYAHRRRGGRQFHRGQEALDHENQATTRVYVQRITVKRDRHGNEIAGRMKLAPDEGRES
jgi:integrase